MVVRSLNDIDEAKFAAFNSMRFKSICFGLEYGGVKRWLHLPVASSSLLNVFRSNRYIRTSLGKNNWRSLIPDSTLQLNCNREGINVKWDGQEGNIVRIGFVGNNENECRSPDSAIGAGFDPGAQGCTRDFGYKYSGNFAGCGGDKGNKVMPATSYILVK